MIPPPVTRMSASPFSSSSRFTRGKEGHVGAGQDRERDDVHVLLERRAGDHLGGLVKAGVDDLHPGIPQRGGDYLGSTIVAVQTRLGHENPDPAFRHIRDTAPLCARARINESRRRLRPLIPEGRQAKLPVPGGGRQRDTRVVALGDGKRLCWAEMPTLRASGESTRPAGRGMLISAAAFVVVIAGMRAAAGMHCAVLPGRLHRRPLHGPPRLPAEDGASPLARRHDRGARTAGHRYGRRHGARFLDLRLHARAAALPAATRDRDPGSAQLGTWLRVRCIRRLPAALLRAREDPRSCRHHPGRPARRADEHGPDPHHDHLHPHRGVRVPDQAASGSGRGRGLPLPSRRSRASRRMCGGISASRRW